MYCLDATLEGHSSKAIAIVEAKFDWICILSSGPIKIFLPSTCELKYTPSSFIFLSPARENTWNPPESVRMGLSQFINLWRPPNFLTTLSPGLTWRWYVLDNSTCVLIVFKSSAATAPLIAAAVPTFIKTGVWILPWTVVNSPRFAFPSFAKTLNIKHLIDFIFFNALYYYIILFVLTQADIFNLLLSLFLVIIVKGKNFYGFYLRRLKWLVQHMVTFLK